MIEYWQAGAITLGAIVITMIAMLAAQRLQQQHDAEMQEQRLEAERTNRQEEALRTVKREQLQPLVDVLAELDKLIAARLWERLNLLDGAFLPPYQDSIDMPALGMKLIAASVRVRDSELRSALYEMVVKANKAEAEWLTEHAPRIHARLEAYSVSLGQEQP